MSPRDRSWLGPALLALSIALGSSAASADPAGLLDARDAFEAAEKLGTSPDNKVAWRRAATMYLRVLEAAPEVATAHEAAMFGAKAYRIAGDFESAIQVYEIFVRAGGRRLPSLASDPRHHDELVQSIADLSAEIAAVYLLNFDYVHAAARYNLIMASTARDATRRDAASNAFLVWSAIGDKAKAAAARATLLKLSTTALEHADDDTQAAGIEFRKWDSRAPDEGLNRDARRAALSAMERWLSAHKSETAGRTQYDALKMAHDVAQLRRAGHEPHAEDTCKDAIRIFDQLKQRMGASDADLAAECSYWLLDREITADFGRTMRPHRYKGTVPEVEKAYLADLARAKGYAQRLEELTTKFALPTWTIAAKARQGSLYDACWTALTFVLPPAQPLLDQAARLLVRGYSEAVVLGWSQRIHIAAADMALPRLAFFTDMLGDSQMRAYTADLGVSRGDKPFRYSDGMFLLAQPGMTLSRPSDLVPAPAPVAP